ncbi:MAG: sulfatase-like hydrolase/transferase [Acholeplasma sp.]|nr:sulfatase-like hydrolase/transferase [Acholeplasma sp.]
MFAIIKENSKYGFIIDACLIKQFLMYNIKEVFKVVVTINSKKQQRYFYVFVGLFILTNIINTYFLTTQVWNRYISPVSRTISGEITAIFGNFSILFLIVIVTFLVFKKDKNRMITLLVVTLILNLFIFALGFFNLFYSTAFDTNAFDIFKNPAEGMATGLVSELLSELILYYRIVVFIPIIILAVFYKKYCSTFKNSKRKQSFYMYPYRFITMILVFGLTFFGSTASFITKFRNDDFAVNSVLSTSATQNYGVYPFYVLDFLGVDLNYTTRTDLKLESDEDLFNAYNYYNKNKDSYVNVLDGKEYSNSIALEDSVINEKDTLGVESLTGIFADRNLVLVHLESLNYFLWQVPEVRERFEFLNKLFEESFVFENYYTSVGIGVSSDAEASVLTGLYMNGYSTFYREASNKDYEIDTLPKLFAEKGYKSQGIHADYEKFYNRDYAYPNTIGFTEDYFSLENFVARSGFTGDASEYSKDRQTNHYSYDHYKYSGNLELVSPWPSEYELADVTYEQAEKLIDNYMLFSIYMTPHTPFMFNPFYNQEYSFEGYSELKEITKRYMEFATYIDETIESYFVDPKTGEPRLSSDNVYVFYSDHGSSLKNGDLSKLFEGDNISLLDERRMLQQIISFIYAPSDEKTETVGINKGVITGTQDLVRGHVDLYRTIGDLFGLFNEDDFYFGVHGMSKEPTFVIDNRIQDLIVDDISRIGTENYVPYIMSLRDLSQRTPVANIPNEDTAILEIKKFKKLSDLLLHDDKVYPIIKKALQK